MLIKLKVHAGSKAAALLKKAQNSYEVWVRAAAERGLANKAALESLAQALNQNPKQLRIVKGSRSPNKIVKTDW